MINLSKHCVEEMTMLCVQCSLKTGLVNLVYIEIIHVLVMLFVSNMGNMQMITEWDDEHARVVCELFAEQVGNGNQPSTHLSNLGYVEVANRFKGRTGL